MRIVDPDQHLAKRREILSSARVIFARHGFHRTSTDMICKAAGISSGSLFHYFPTKKALILALVEQEGRDIAAAMEALSRLDDPVGAVEHFLDGIVKAVDDGTERNLVLEIAAESARDVDVATLSKTGDEALRHGLEAIVRQGVETGAFAPVVSPSQFADFMLVVIDGIFSRSSTDPDYSAAQAAPSIRNILTAALGVADAQ
ncbi:TetR/AcrR family transcriptional regulator [Agrobacterium sp. NPDC090283]|uniref:TetR/AcrR family transcriptional regulator n=1 Tax=Agrobacterium sp. NPDC090283 TaxID=3363920 RepID=UPI00383A4F0E